MQMSDSLYTLSLKGSRSDQPWLVVNAGDADELDTALEALSDELLSKITNAQAAFQVSLGLAENRPSTRAAAPQEAPAQTTDATPPARQRNAAPANNSYARSK